MTPTLDHLPKGWQPLAEEFLRKAERDIRGITITELSVQRGWLSVDYDRNSVSIKNNWHASKLCEGVSSISWHVCVECGSHHGEQRAGHILPICESCIS